MTIISGEVSESGQLIILRHNNFTVEHMQQITPGAFKITYLTPGEKDVIFRRSDGQIVGYGLVEPYQPNTTGAMYSTGRNSYGLLGQNTITHTSSISVVGEDTDWASVSNNDYHAMAIKRDGTLWGCGYNNAGRLGIEDKVDRSTFTQVSSDTDWIDVVCGFSFTFALKNDGTLWFAGDGGYGSSGMGLSQFFASTFTKVGTDEDWTKICTNESNSVHAIKTDGSLWGWGLNDSYCALGIGNTNRQSTPVRLGLDNDWQWVSTNMNNGVAIKNDGSLWCWGENAQGQHGSNSRSLRSIPYNFTSLPTNWVKASVNSMYISILNTDGEIYASGYLYYAGCNLNAYRSTFTKMGTDTDWEDVSAGQAHGLGLKTDGSLWCWGNNEYGELGFSERFPVRVTPVRIGSDNNWSYIRADRRSSFAIK